MRNLSITEAIDRLTPLLKERRLNAFVGAGISKSPPSNLPLWSELINEFIKFFESQIEQAKLLTEYSELKRLATDARDVRHSGNSIGVATALRDALINLDRTHNLGVKTALQRWLQRRFYAAVHNPLHASIVTTDFQYVLTTNYDSLLETAAEASGVPLAALSAISFNEPERLARSIHERQSAIIYVHGDARQIALDEIVFTAADYAKMLNKSHRGFALVVRALFLTNSTLFLGYGGIDPHIEAIIEELALNLEYSQLDGMPRQYEVVERKNVDAIMESAKRRKRTDLIVIDKLDDYQTLLTALQKISPRRVS